jgi:type I restriction enzyme, S subunit
MEVKAGYKQTDVGAIPEDWDVIPLGNFLSLQRGHDLTEYQRRQGDIPVMGSAGQNGFHDTAIVKGPGVVIGRSGASFGQAHFCEHDYWPHNTAIYVTDFRGNDPLFSYFFLKSMDFRRYNSGGAQQSLNRNFINPILVSIPKPPEQRTIATTLSDVDAFITSLDQLIAKKHDIKQAAMQELFTGNRRLPGFDSGNGFKHTEVGMIPEDWSVKKLVSFVLHHNAGIYKNQDLYGAGYNIAGVSDIYDIHSIDGQDFRRVPLSKQELKQYSLECNDLLYGESSLVREGIARTVYVTENGVGTVFAWHTRRYCIDQGFLISSYLYYYLQTRTARKHMMENCIQTAITGINTTDYFNCPIILPPQQEQQAIATVLSEMDTELTALEQKRDKTKAIKQGIMQELLTGRIRLV